jgi:2-polyprenyl-3-methyl-5-hydroxy-6-metoxy-1,4-benzoquinol methylase
MITHSASLGYDTPSSEYYRCLHPEMLPFVPSRCRRVLDVGCAEGVFGESLKKTREIEVWGVESVEFAVAIALTKLDYVVEGVFGPEINLPLGVFDCIVFNDVLERMAAPDMALCHARALLAPGGVIVASIPHIRNFRVGWQLLFYARWDYGDCGVLDRTHLRFFTKSSIVSMFEREGLEIESICGINAYKGTPNASRLLWRAYRLANVFSSGSLTI